MSEKHYRPIMKDGDHLVQFKKNTNRVIGQICNAENKNPDIIEWEEVEDADYECGLAKMSHEECMAEVRSRQLTADICFESHQFKYILRGRWHQLSSTIPYMKSTKRNSVSAVGAVKVLKALKALKALKYAKNNDED